VFRVEFFVDDKKLGNALRALTGLAADNPTVQPVVNAMKTNGKVKAKGNGDAVSLFADYAKENKFKEFAARDLKAFCKHAGWAESSASYFAKKLVDAHVLKKMGKGNQVRYAMVNA
jgi:hypothetical protein